MYLSAQKLQVICILAFVLHGQAAFVALLRRRTYQAKTATLTSERQSVMQGLPLHSSYWRHRQAHLCASSESDNMDWLSNPMPDSSETQLAKSTQDEPPDDLGNIMIPSTGISVTDELEEAQKDKFDSTVVPINGLPGVAQIVTTASGGGIEPVRYLASLSPPRRLAPANDDTTVKRQEPPMSKTFVMVDIPPFSEKLLAQINKFMGHGSSLRVMLITSRDVIHYDDAPAVFTTRKSDLEKWAGAFPGVEIVGYRLDIPRDAREMVTQRLDGYGPWALDESFTNVTFVETGRPLTYKEWDKNVAKRVMDEGTTPPDDELLDDLDDDDLYTPEAIRNREEGKRLLAIYTPGHTFGSVTFIFPEIQACCSGYTIPVEDDRYDETMGIGGGGPALDFRGYITTSRAGMSRMMESARHVVDTYSDRFTVVLPSRGDPLFVDSCVEDRKEALNDIIDQYDKIGKIYEQLGITLADD